MCPPLALVGGSIYTSEHTKHKQLVSSFWFLLLDFFVVLCLLEPAKLDILVFLHVDLPGPANLDIRLAHIRLAQSTNIQKLY